MALLRIDHVGIVVDDIAAAIDFFVALGFENRGEGEVEGEQVDSIIAVEGARSKIAMMRTPDGAGTVELTEFQSPAYEGDEPPAPANAPGLRHLCCAVDDFDATFEALRARGAEPVGNVEDFGGYRLVYLRGPAGIIVEVAEQRG